MIHYHLIWFLSFLRVWRVFFFLNEYHIFSNGHMESLSRLFPQAILPYSFCLSRQDSFMENNYIQEREVIT